MARAEAARRRRRANLIGQTVALLVALGGLCIVVVPALWSKEAREVVLKPFPDRVIAKTIETTAADGTRTVETSWVEDSSLDRALAGGGAVLLRLGIVAAAAFLAGAATQRASLAHFALEMGPIKFGELPETADASLDAVVGLAARIDAQDSVITTSSFATERALLKLTSDQVSDKEEFLRASQSLLRLRAEHDQQRRDLDNLRAEVAAGGPRETRKWLRRYPTSQNRSKQ